MLTFFATAKPFHGHSGIIQRNTLRSWKLLHPDVEVILFGDEEGAADVCAELSLRHEPYVEKHASGMKYLNFMFERAQQVASHDFLCYSNCDIVLMKDFRRAFEKAHAWRDAFLMVAQRWDTEVTQPLNFDSEGWASELHRLALTTGSLQAPQFVDFFVFPRGAYESVPPLVVGRSYWDHWLVWKALSLGLPVLDAGLAVVPVHQNHTYGYHQLGKLGTHEDELAIRNAQLSGDGKHLRCILDATHRITAGGKIRRIRFRRQLQSPTAMRIRNTIATRTFELRRRLGLRTESIHKLLGIRPRSLE